MSPYSDMPQACKPLGLAFASAVAMHEQSVSQAAATMMVCVWEGASDQVWLAKGLGSHLTD